MIAKAISHEARLPLLTDVDELRMRLIVCAAVLAVAFGFAFWQNPRRPERPRPPPVARHQRRARALTRPTRAERPHPGGPPRSTQSPAHRLRPTGARLEPPAASRTQSPDLGRPSRRRRGH